MAKITNFDELKRLHDWARIAKVGSKEWIDFATTMIDSFPALYEKAKAINKKLNSLDEPTEKMLIAGLNETEPLGSLIDWKDGFGREEMRKAFKAMIAVSGDEK